jgi:hypothetical protein
LAAGRRYDDVGAGVGEGDGVAVGVLVGAGDGAGDEGAGDLGCEGTGEGAAYDE